MGTMAGVAKVSQPAARCFAAGVLFVSPLENMCERVFVSWSGGTYVKMRE